MFVFILLSNIDFHRLILSFLVRFRAHDKGKNAGAVIASFTSSITTLIDNSLDQLARDNFYTIFFYVYQTVSFILISAFCRSSF